MIEPQLAALLWAACCASVLRTVKRPLTDVLDRIGLSLPSRAKLVLQLLMLASYTGLLIWCHDLLWPNSTLTQRSLFIGGGALVAVILLLPWVLSTDTFATLVIIFALMIVASFFSFFVLKKCFEESVIATGMLRDFISEYVDVARNTVHTREEGVDLVWNVRS